MSNLSLSVDEADGSLRDPSGQRVFLRGFNVGGRCKWAPWAPGELEHGEQSWEALAHRMTRRIQAWGMNFMRLSLNWEALEPTRGVYDELYMSNLEHMLDAAHLRGVGVMLDFHQDLYAAPLRGNGFPVWTMPPALQSGLRPQHRAWFLGYALDPRVAQCFERFWTNADGIQDAFGQMWSTVLERLGHHPALVAIDLINEPSWGAQANLERFKRDTLIPFFGRMIERIGRAHPNLIIGYGAPGVECTPLVPHKYTRPHTHAHIMATPHLYDPALLLTPKGGMSTDPARALARMARFGRDSATPVCIGEFGVTHGARQADQWLNLVLDGLDRHGLHAAYWEYSESSALWNGEDLNVVDARSAPRDILDVYTRPWVDQTGLDEHTYTLEARAQRARLQAPAPTQDTSSHLRLPHHIACPAPPEGVHVSPQGLVLEHEAHHPVDVTLSFERRGSPV